MTTSSTIHFRSTDPREQDAICYRHWDGYPAVGGADVLLFADTKPVGSPREVAAAFLAFLHAKHDDRTGEGIYQDPSDIEYRYTVLCDGSGVVLVEHIAMGDQDPSDIRVLTWNAVIEEQDAISRDQNQRLSESPGCGSWSDYRPQQQEVS